MGFLDFVRGGGGDLITGLAGTIAGAVSSSKDRKLQEKLQQQQYGIVTGKCMRYKVQTKTEEWNNRTNGIRKQQHKAKNTPRRCLTTQGTKIK